MKNELHDYILELHELTLDKKIYEDYADAKQIYEAMEDLKKTVLSKLKNKVNVKTEVERERLAYADQEFEDYLLKLKDLRKEFLKQEATKLFILNRINALITLISLEKEKMKII